MQLDLMDGSKNFCFRGTDDNIVAWKEDFNLGLGEVPAQKLASEIFEQIWCWLHPLFA